MLIFEYEHYLSAEEKEKKTHPRIYSQDEDKRRQGHIGSPPKQGQAQIDRLVFFYVASKQPP